MDQRNAQEKVHDKWWQPVNETSKAIVERDNRRAVPQEDTRDRDVRRVETKDEVYGVWG